MGNIVSIGRVRVIAPISILLTWSKTEVSCNSCTRSDGDVMEDTEDLVQPPGPDSDFHTAMKDTEDPAQPPGPDSDYNTAMKDTEDPVQPPGTDSAYNTGMKDTEDPVQPPGTDSDIM